jgi:hypothetical protein
MESGFNGFERKEPKGDPCEMSIRELHDRLAVAYGSDVDQALNEFRTTGEVTSDVDPEIIEEIQHAVSTFGAPAVEDAIDKLAA